MRSSDADDRSACFSVLTPDHGRGGVWRDDIEIAVSADPGTLVAQLFWAVNRHVIQPVQDRVLLHAGAVARGDAVVLLPAAMESGKTTLVAGLLDTGLAYLTDEAVALSADGLVQGYRKPLSLDPGSWPVLPHHEPELPQRLKHYHRDQWQVLATGFTDVVAEGYLRLLVFPEYVADQPVRLEPLSGADALRHASSCAFAVEETSSGIRELRGLKNALTDVPAFRLSFGRLDEAVATVRRLMAAADDA
ncbi:hypothetical protein GCM10011354_13690 [Egicoccus halophilus]|uniref:Hpr(Ser) kinase/phosphatase n=2 Tax=Egicoccus halophilus TaxID=1670830 RepID=A0A8J3A9L9_9ACTN|nr:hypothetical protein GCM10011354_13690 [Egicoccus halophilus]